MKQSKKKYLILNLKKEGLKIRGGVEEGTPGTTARKCDPGQDLNTGFTPIQY